MNLLDANLVIEPVLICQCRQVIQCQRVFLVDHPEGGNRPLNDRSAAFGNFCENDVLPAQAGKYNATVPGIKLLQITL